MPFWAPNTHLNPWSEQKAVPYSQKLCQPSRPTKLRTTITKSAASFTGCARSNTLCQRLDFDGGDKWLIAVEVGVTFWEDANNSKFVFAEAVGEAVEPPPQNDHVGGGKGKGQFIRRGLRLATIVVFGIRIGFKSVFNQLAGVEAAPPPIEMELDAEAIHVGGLVTIVFEEVHGHRLVVVDG